MSWQRFEWIDPLRFGPNFETPYRRYWVFRPGHIHGATVRMNHASGMWFGECAGQRTAELEDRTGAAAAILDIVDPKVDDDD